MGFNVKIHDKYRRDAEGSDRQGVDSCPEILISMENVTVKYGKTKVLDRISWTMKAGENWDIFGPNGCGKTTLLNLVTGDNPPAFANKIYLFGKR